VEIERARELARAALAFLEANRQRINDLNVYPVPDGDTGTNLVATVRGVVDALENSSAMGQAEVATELKRAALREAKGNSGVILSQIVRGFADVLSEHDEISASVLAKSFRAGSDAAYRAVQRPVEGTMLTVIREMAEEGESPVARRLSPADLLERLVRRGESALERTPDLLPILKEAGVVDAGGAGLVELVRGLAAGVAGKPLPSKPVDVEALGFDAIHQELSRYRYCTVFLVDGEQLDLEALERELEVLGDSLLVVGDSAMVKVHVHTDDPGAALRIGTGAGVLEGVEIANMHAQTQERESRLTASDPVMVDELVTGVVAVVAGAGNRALFESEGASVVIEGGQTMNPSVGEIHDAIEAVHADHVIVLPNNKNVILTAEQAASLSSKTVRVIPTRSVQEGLGAIIPYERDTPVETNEAEMLAGAEAVVTGEVTRASRDAKLDGVEVREGAWLGLANDAAVASGDDFEAVADAVIERLLEGERELLTVLTGDGAPAVDGLLGRARERHPGLEVEVHAGGQPHYPLLLSAE
jgi:DAK2 domain fusion protein YloV